MRDDARTDAELVDAINAGPPGAEPAFAALYARYRDFCLRIARRMTPDDQTAADVVQDTFLALLDRFPGFALRAKMTTYLYAVVRNRATSMARGRRPSVEATHESLGAPDAGGADAEGIEALHRAVMKLPEAQREVLLMRIVDEMSVGDVAMALGVPTGTVKSRLHAALESLRDHPQIRAWFGPS